MIPAGLTLSPLPSSSLRFDRIASAGSKSGVEVEGRLVEVEQRLADHRHLGGRAQPVRAGDPAQLDEHRPGLLLRPGGRRLGDQVRRPPRGTPRRRTPRSGWPIPASTAAASSPSPSPIASSSLRTLSCRRGGTVRHHAEVEQGQPAVVGEQQVARVRVGVQEAVVQHQPQVAAEQLLHHRPGVHVEQAERPDVGDLAALDALHGEHPRGGVVEDRLGHHEQVVVLGQVAELQQVARPRGGSPARRPASGGTARAAARSRTAGRRRCACRRDRRAGPASPCRHATTSRASGRWTLTTTSRPLRRVARWTWPREAAASGSSLEVREQVPDLAPSSASTISSTCSKGNGSALSWSRASAVGVGGRAAGRSGWTAAGRA